tara:strand:+ start:24 stop:1505 length:1482 start_codon:yes stop_codon:yes gene_type:complete
MKPFIHEKTISEIENIITSNLYVNLNNKVQYGEVFTPFNLIVEILDTLPKNLWENPNLKWLEPGSGLGNFSMVIFYYLHNGLKKWEPNSLLRTNHIINNMLFMIEINNSNVIKSKSFFGSKSNILNVDYLSDKNEWMKKINISYFDIIVGNPPYNSNGIKGKGRINIGEHVIWPSFVNTSLDILNKNGYCLFLTPNSWTELKSPLSKKILTNQIVTIKNFDLVKSYKLFDKKAASMPLCYYLIKKAKPINSTLLYDDVLNKFIEFDIMKFKIIPNKNISLIKKILLKNNDSLQPYFKFTPPKVKKDNYNYSKKYKPPYVYPLINYVHKKIIISYSKQCSFVQNKKPKLIFSNYSMGYPILDKYGVLDIGGRTSYYIEIPDNNINKLKKIQDFFLTDLGFTLINSLKTAQKFMSTRTFSIIPDVTKFNFQINNKSLEKYYNLNSNDLLSINHQKNNGEGNITPQQYKQITSFKLSNLKSIKKNKKCNNSTRKKN